MIQCSPSFNQDPRRITAAAPESVVLRVTAAVLVAVVKMDVRQLKHDQVLLVVVLVSWDRGSGDCDNKQS